MTWSEFTPPITRMDTENFNTTDYADAHRGIFKPQVAWRDAEGIHTTDYADGYRLEISVSFVVVAGSPLQRELEGCVIKTDKRLFAGLLYCGWAWVV